MGLLSAVKKATGAVKNRATSAIGALKATKVGQAAVRTGGMIAKSPVGKVATKVASSPVVRFAGKMANPLKKVGYAVTAVSLASKGVKAIRARSAKKKISGRTVALGAGGAAVGGAAMAAAMKAAPQTATAQSGLLERAVSWVKANPVKTAVGAAAVAAAGYGIYKAVKKRKSKKRKSSSPRRRKKRSPSSRSRRRSSSSTRRRKRRYGSEAQYKRRGGLDVKYTRNGQPYVIQRNGRARFIKRSRR